VEQTFPNREKHGKWLDAQIEKEKECNWKSDFSTVLNARNLSEKYSAKRRFKPKNALTLAVAYQKHKISV